jgi:hypothetical protein
LCPLLTNRRLLRIICIGVILPNVSLQIQQSKLLRMALPVALCLLVFFFALHAKTAVYNGGSPVKISPATASKLWLSGQKLQAPPIQFDHTPLLFWFLAVSLFGFCLNRRPLIQSVVVVPQPSNIRLWHLRRFLRPPPIQL